MLHGLHSDSIPCIGMRIKNCAQKNVAKPFISEMSYSPYLLMKYNCYINTEYCASLKRIKCIYISIYIKDMIVQGCSQSEG